MDVVSRSVAFREAIRCHRLATSMSDAHRARTAHNRTRCVVHSAEVSVGRVEGEAGSRCLPETSDDRTIVGAYAFSIATDVTRVLIKLQLNVATEFLVEEALQKADELNEYFARTGKLLGALHGIPVSVKVSGRRSPPISRRY